MRVQRLLDMSPAELGWRARDLAQTTAERVRWHLRRPRWSRDHIRRALAPNVISPTVRRALDQRDWQGVHDALADGIAARPARFVLDPAGAAALAHEVALRWPHAAAAAAARAERLLSGRYDLLGYRNLFLTRRGTALDWHADAVHSRRAPSAFYRDVRYLSPDSGDHKIIWELNRHQHWLPLGRAAWLTGDTRYAREIVQQLDSWLAQNPPLTGINWSSMLEVGLRAVAWTWTLHALLAFRELLDSPWLVDLLVALDRSLTHVERHLSYYFSPNTHLTGEALALYVTGTALPELGGSRRWAETGRRILLGEISRQITSDGGHVERSAHYHRYTLDFYLLATLTARLAGDVDTAQRFEEAAGRLAEYARTIADDRGELPLLGDDDGGMLWPLTGRPCVDVRDSLAVAAAVIGRADLAPWGACEEVCWIAGPDAVVPAGTAAPPASTLLHATGYFVARDGRGSHAVFDVGPHGYLNGGHAHADALALTLAIDGTPLLVDTGTSTYTVHPHLRDRMRSSSSHNTVTVDRQSPSVPAGPFHWRSTTDARLLSARRNPAFDWIEAAHDGYPGLVHRRTVVRSADAGWLVVDVIDGHGRHHAAAHWHLHPAWSVVHDAGRIRATHQDGSSAWLLHDPATQSDVLRGDDITGLGWYAPVYGVLVPASTVRVQTESDAPIVLVTWIGSAEVFPSPTMTLVDASRGAIVVEVRDDRRTALFRVRQHVDGAGTAEGRAGEFDTDARMLHYTTENGRLRSLSIAEGQWCRTRRPGWPSLSAPEPMADLCLSSGGDGWELTSLQPPSQMVIEGIDVSTSRLEGGHLPLSSNRSTDRLLIRDAAWRQNGGNAARVGVFLDSGAAFARH